MQQNFVVVVDWCHTKTDLQVNVVCRSVQYLGARKTTFVKLKTKLWVALYSIFPPLFVTGSLNLFERMKTSFYQRLWLDPALSVLTAQITANTLSAVCTVDWWEVAWLRYPRLVSGYIMSVTSDSWVNISELDKLLSLKRSKKDTSVN